MACNHPLKRFILPDGSGKVTSYSVKYLVSKSRGIWLPVTDPLPGDKFYPLVTEYQEIPCGHCIACRLEYSRQWANRMMMELQYHEKACFITLTYDDRHLPDPNRIMDVDSDGVVFGISPLIKKDLQKFIKKLRNNHRNDFNFKVRYYGVGEYGSESMRPHYHIILFGYDFPDRYPFSRSSTGFTYFRSTECEDLWPYGYSYVCNVSWDTCAYVARYVTKKKYGKESEFYGLFDIPAEFSLMSRKPGIGRQYYDDHKDEIYKNEEIAIATDTGKRVFRPPKYFDNIYDIEYPEESEILKEKKRRIADINKKLRSNLSTLDYLSQLKVDEMNLEARISALKRR